MQLVCGNDPTVVRVRGTDEHPRCCRRRDKMPPNPRVNGPARPAAAPMFPGSVRRGPGLLKRPVRRWSGVPEQPVVLGVRPDPEPDQIGPIFDRQRPIMQADPNRPEATDLLQMERGMPRVLSKQ